MNCEMFQKADSYWQWLRLEKGWHKGWENKKYGLTQATILKCLKSTLSSGEQHLSFMPRGALIQSLGLV